MAHTADIHRSAPPSRKDSLPSSENHLLGPSGPPQLELGPSSPQSNLSKWLSQNVLQAPSHFLSTGDFSNGWSRLWGSQLGWQRLCQICTALWKFLLPNPAFSWFFKDTTFQDNLYSSLWLGICFSGEQLVQYLPTLWECLPRYRVRTEKTNKKTPKEFPPHPLLLWLFSVPVSCLYLFTGQFYHQQDNHALTQNSSLYKSFNSISKCRCLVLSRFWNEMFSLIIFSSLKWR